MHQVKPSNPSAKTPVLGINESSLVVLDETANLLKSNVTNKVEKAMELFSKASQKERAEVYNELYQLIPFVHDYWGCAEDAFHDRKELHSTPEQKAQAIENYLVQMIAAAKQNPNGPAPGNKAIHILFRRMADLFKINQVQNAMELFAKMPEEHREGIYKELYQLIPFTHDYWRCAEDAFHDRNELSATPDQKARAIQNYLIQNIADLFKSRSDSKVIEAMDLFARIPQDQKEKVFVELYLLISFDSDYWRCGEDAFYNQNNQTSTPEQKAQAIQNYLIKLRLPPKLTPREKVANRKAFHVKILEERCSRAPRFGGELNLKFGETCIRRSSTYSVQKPSYTVIANRGLMSGNDHILVAFDENTGDLLCRGKTFQSLDNLLANFPPISATPHAITPPRNSPKPPPAARGVTPRSPISPLNPKPRPLASSPIAQAPIPVPAGLEIKPYQVALEPILEEDELAFDQDTSLIDATGERTLGSIAFLRNLSIYKYMKLFVDGVAYTPINGGTQDFSTECTASCGSSSGREIILLDPNNSPKLAAHFIALRSRLNANMTTYEVLDAVKLYVRTEIFPSCIEGTNLESELNLMIREALKTHPLATHKSDPLVKIPLMTIDEFIGKAAVCRHHAHVTAYLIDRLLKEENPLIEGTVQHIRGNLSGFIRGAHVWITFIPKKKRGVPDEKFHLDTLWDVLRNFADENTMKTLQSSYGRQMMNDQIKRTNCAAQINGQPESQVTLLS